MKHAIYVPPFGELADPRVLAELAVGAEERGWDGFFVWDHIVYRAPVRAVADPWVALAARLLDQGLDDLTRYWAGSSLSFSTEGSHVRQSRSA